MATHNHNPEAEQKKPSVTDSVQSLIDKKKAEKESEVSASMSEKVAGTQDEVAEVMGVVEKPSEKVSKKAGEKGEGKMPKGGQAAAGDDDAQAIAISLKDYKFPSEEMMVKKVRSAINAQIKLEWEKAKKFDGSLLTGGAEGYNASIAKVRHLKQLLSSLFTATFSALKDFYVKYFTPDGKRKRFDEI